MTAEHKIMTIFENITIRLTICFRQKSGTVKEIKKTVLQTSQKKSLCSF